VLSSSIRNNVVEVMFVTEISELNKLLNANNPSDDPQSIILTRVDNASTLPGQPRVSLFASDFNEYLRTAFLTPELDQAVSKLWLVSYKTYTLSQV